MNFAHARIFLAAAALCLCASCAQNTRRSPALSQPTQPDSPEKKSLLSRTADTTWNVVSAPVRWVAPGKKPVVTDQETFEPADAVIMTPSDSSSPR